MDILKFCICTLIPYVNGLANDEILKTPQFNGSPVGNSAVLKFNCELWQQLIGISVLFQVNFKTYDALRLKNNTCFNTDTECKNGTCLCSYDGDKFEMEYWYTSNKSHQSNTFGVEILLNNRKGDVITLTLSRLYNGKDFGKLQMTTEIFQKELMGRSNENGDGRQNGEIDKKVWIFASLIVVLMVSFCVWLSLGKTDKNDDLALSLPLLQQMENKLVTTDDGGYPNQWNNYKIIPNSKGNVYIDFITNEERHSRIIDALLQIPDINILQVSENRNQWHQDIQEFHLFNKHESLSKTLHLCVLPSVYGSDIIGLICNHSWLSLNSSGRYVGCQMLPLINLEMNFNSGIERAVIYAVNLTEIYQYRILVTTNSKPLETIMWMWQGGCGRSQTNVKEENPYVLTMAEEKRMKKGRKKFDLMMCHSPTKRSNRLKMQLQGKKRKKRHRYHQNLT